MYIFETVISIDSKQQLCLRLFEFTIRNLLVELQLLY